MVCGRVFKGKLELDNLTLKRTALQKLGLPLYVETGASKPPLACSSHPRLFCAVRLVWAVRCS